MSYDPYDNQDRRQRSDRHRESRRNRPTYEEETYEVRSGPRPSRHTDLVRRRDDSVEDIEREFPPGDPYIQRRGPARRARSAGRDRYDDDYADRRRNKRYDDRKSTDAA